MERKIGEVFEYNGEWYQCIKVDPIINADGIINYCEGCSISASECDNFNCIDDQRSDKELVIFKKLVKLGEPFELLIDTNKKVLMQEYKIYGDMYIWENKGVLHTDCFNGIRIEIKQNKKEDVEEKKQKWGVSSDTINEINKGIEPMNTSRNIDTERSRAEGIRRNLKPFNLEAAKAGKPVCTRDGRKAIFLTTLSNKNFPVVAIVSCGQEENIYQYDINGVCDEHDDNLDLMMLPEKKEGWVNVYKETTGEYYMDKLIHKTEKFATDVACSDNYIGTVKISWEE